MTKKKLLRDLTQVRVGDPVWAFMRYPNPRANPTWHRLRVVGQNRAFWLLEGASGKALKLPKRIYEGDTRGLAYLVYVGLVAFSEDQRDLFEWIRANTEKVVDAVRSAGAFDVLRVAELLGMKNFLSKVPWPGEETR